MPLMRPRQRDTVNFLPDAIPGIPYSYTNIGGTIESPASPSSFNPLAHNALDDAFRGIDPPATPRAGRATGGGAGVSKPPPLLHPDLKVKTTDPPGVASLKNQLAERHLGDRLQRERSSDINLKRGHITPEEAEKLKSGELTGSQVARRRVLRHNLSRGLITPEQYDRLL